MTEQSSPTRRCRRQRRRPADQRRGQFAISERQMPNGSVIEVRSGHLPDGSFVQTFTDITKRREAEAHVARLASEDPLTGLPNRRVFRADARSDLRAAAGRRTAPSARNSRSCSSISTASRSSTTRSAIASAICCCRKWRSG